MKTIAYRKHSRKHSLWLALLLSGCAVGPKYVQPDIADITLASPQAAQLQGAQNSLPADWWTFFKDDALNRQIQAALEHNHDIRRAYANLLAARALFDARQWERLPNLDANAGYTRGIQQQGSSSAPQRALSQSWRAALDVQWEIDLFGCLKRLSESAQAQAQASAADLAQIRLAIAAEVAQSWFDAQGLQRRLVKIAQAAFRHLQQQRAIGGKPKAAAFFLQAGNLRLYQRKAGTADLFGSAQRRFFPQCQFCAACSVFCITKTGQKLAIGRDNRPKTQTLCE